MSAVDVVAPADVDVCICTYRRASLTDTLRSLAALELPSGTTLQVIIADNDETCSARDIVAQAEQDYGLKCHYIHAPARNISIARNACLDAASASLVAFIDDDETASESWLFRLLKAHKAAGNTVTFGSVIAKYPPTPRWLELADLHSLRPIPLPNGHVPVANTANVLLNRAELGSHRFNVAFGRSGGEDTVFFAALRRSGRRFGYCADAYTFENVPPHRARLRWLMIRSFRTGQTHAKLLEDAQANLKLAGALAAVKLGYCLVIATAQIWSAHRWRRTAVRGVLHAGVIAKLFGMNDLRLY